MKRWIGFTFGLVAVIVMLVSATAQAPIVAAEMPSFNVSITDFPATVQPGGTYNLTIEVTRPAGMALPAWASGSSPPKWEVRTYFYNGLNCYSQGDWTEIDGDLLYSGWWDWRQQGDSWTAGMSDTRTFTVTNKIVDYPRPEEDIAQDMDELPIDGEITLKARFRMRWGGNLTFAGGELSFVYNGQTYGGPYENKSTADEEKYKVTSGGSTYYIEKSDGGYWQIDFDTTKTNITVSAASPDGGGETPWMLIIGAVVGVIALVAIVVVLKKRSGGKSPRSEFMPPSSPEMPPAPREAPPEMPPSQP